ncbi:MAG: autotransporter-associated beta strand repeat-containing protein, partial [Thermoguttaceae bacterium]
GANLANADLYSGTLTNTNLSFATLANANLTGANLTSANLSSGTLTNATLTNANLANASLQSAILTNATLINSSLQSATLTNANLTGATVAGASFGGSNLTASQLNSTASYQTKNLQGIGLVGNNLTGWNFSGQNLTGANLSSGTLTNANLTNANLTNASLQSATLINANLTGATVAGANLGSTNLTAAQLYSTASYQTRNLQGIDLGDNNFAGWNFSGQNLTNAYLASATLTNASLAGATLTNANLSGATLTNANLAEATVAGASFGGSNLTAAQLYNTASYQIKSLQGIGLGNVTGWNFSGQNLTGANLVYATLTNATLTNATLTNAYLIDSTLTNANLAGANLTNASLNNAGLSSASLTNANLTDATLSGANLTGADLRGAQGFLLNSAVTGNAILPDGTIQGLDLSSNSPPLLVRNYSGNIPIHIIAWMTMNAGTSLVFEFDGNPWGSTISFDAGTPVTLGGNIELGLAPGVDPIGLLGQSAQLFDWTGVSPTGQFAQIISGLPARYLWDTSALYTRGEVDLTISATPISGQWANNGSGTWSGTANWTGGNVPGAPQDTAVFGAALTSGTATVTLDSVVSLASLTFSTSAGASCVINPSLASTLILSNTAGPATISNSGGNNTIAAPITLASNLSVSASTGSALTITGPISESGGSRSLTFGGNGELILSGPNTYSGGTTVGAGTLLAANAASLPGYSTSGSVSVAAGAVLAVQTGNGAAGWSGSQIDSLLANTAWSNNTSVLGIDTTNGNFTYASNISQAVGLTKLGANTLALTGSNTYTGPTTVGGGTLLAASAASLSGYSTSGSVSVAAGAVLAVQTGDGTAGWSGGQIDSLLANATWINNTSVLGIDTTNGDFTYGSNIAQALSVTKLGANTLTLTGSSTYLGLTTIGAGTLQLGDGSGGDDASLNTSGVVNNAALVYNVFGSQAANYTISGSGSLTKAGSGTLTLSGSSYTYSGNTFLTSGTMAMINAPNTAGLPSSSLVMSSNATLDLSAANLGLVAVGSLADAAGSPTGHQVLLGGNTLETGLDNSNTTFSGAISGNGGILIKSGSGTFTLTGTNTYSGGTQINGGILNINGDSALGAASAPLTFTGSGTLQAGVDAIVLNSNRNITVNSGMTATIDTQVFNMSIAGSIGGQGSLTKLGSGTLILSGSNTYAGPTTVGTGTLLAVSAASLPGYNTSGGLSVASGALLALRTGNGTAGWSSGQIDSLLLANANGTYWTTNFAAFGIDTTNGNFTYASNISQAVALAKLGANTLTLTGLNYYNGGTTINAGTLIAGGGGLGWASVNVAGGATLAVAQSGNVGLAGLYYTSYNPPLANFNSLNALQSYIGNVNNPAAVAVTPVLNVGNGGAAFPGWLYPQYDFEGYYSGMIDITKGGTYSFAAGSAAGTVLWIDGQLVVNNNNNNQSFSYPQQTGSINLSAGLHNIVMVYYCLGPGSNSFETGIRGPGASGYTDIGSSSAYPITPDLVVPSLTGRGNVVMQTGNLIVGTDNTSTTFSGNITSSGPAAAIAGVMKVGFGNLTVTGSLIYGGGTTIAGGTLQLGDGTGGHDASLNTSGIVNGAALLYNVFGSQTANYTISGNGTLTKVGPGTLTLSGSNSYSGHTFLTSGAIVINTANNKAGLYEGLVNNNNGADTTDPIPQTSIQPVARWGASTDSNAPNNNIYPDWGDNTTWGYSGYIMNKSTSAVTYTFGKNFDDSAWLVIDGVSVINNPLWSANVTGSITLSPGLHTVDLRFGQGNGGVGPNSGAYDNYGVAYNTVGNTATGGTWLQMGASESNTQFFATVTGAPSSAMVMSSSTTLDLSAPGLGLVSLSSLADAAGSPTGHQVLLGGNTLDTGLDNSSTTFSGMISGNGGSLVKQGTGTFTLAGTNTYGGTTTVSGGTLLATSTASLPGYNTSGKVSVDGGATLAAQTGGGTAGFSSGQIDSLLANATWTNNTSGLGIDTTNGDFTYGSNITWAVGLSKLGANTLTLTGSNTYSGVTTVSGGTLQLASATALPSGANTGNLNINNGTLDLYGNSASANALNGAGTIDTTIAAAPILTIGNKNASGSFPGILQNTAGTLGLVKTGTGAQILGGASTYSGGTSINLGALITTSNSALGSGQVKLASGATLCVGVNGLVGSYYDIIAPAIINNQNAKFVNLPTLTGQLSGQTPSLVQNTAVPSATNSNGAIFDFGTSGNGFPGKYAVGATNFEATFTGVINIPVSGTYTFETASDDGSMMFIDGNTVVDNNYVQNLTPRSGAVSLMAGVHNITIGYYLDGGDYGLYAEILSGPAGASIPAGGEYLPQSWLLPSESDLTIASLTGAGSVQLKGGNLLTGGDNSSTTFSG